MNPDVDEYLSKARQWQEELVTLRAIVLDTPLTEEWKWRAPCYTFQKKNVALIGAFKDNCVLSFFKGALLKDDLGILTKPGENTQAGRVVRFTSLQEIIELEPVLKAYIAEAIEVEKAGLKVDVKKEAEPIPAEFQKKLDESPALQTAFEALTPGRQRGYLMHFSAAKQSKTREARVEKYIPQILDGKGIHDCTCGLSQKLPACDGSHKSIR
ncbi:YdeI/OmpD-associated family protein [Gimesia sp.]|uniref:DUF1801 domain-containing protein n=1 Tax=Gimesia sp. TaxID=2024833 RepID=UPI000C66F230|nr:YdeI/OmpD-associated family protein [Gimesia sp.]MAX38764.1 hypothetical protein [Gimesia sp.]HBL45827.1 hypothetical protein [Planctomycetaceae bacterium]|tara:strand:+ start:5319 stop:5954 length:636 start_codon:yes stop_codon:yes gene_type:complete